MNVAMLSTLAAVLEGGSFAAAAQKVGCTPSAVSLQVKQMEGYFGQPLFDRSGRAVQPTPFAIEVGRVARELTSRIEALRARPQVTVGGRWRLGAIATVQTDALPQALRWLRERHPALVVKVSLNDSDELVAELKAGRIDAAMLVRPQDGGRQRLAWEDVARQPFVLLAPPGTAPAAPRQLLQKLDWIRYDTSLTGGKAAARYVRRVQPAARVAMDVRPIDAIVALVAAGLGVSVVPRPRPALLQAHGVQAFPLGAGAPSRQLAYVRRLADAENRNGDAVLAAFRSVLAGAGPA